jgi:hypothetical protein
MQHLLGWIALTIGAVWILSCACRVPSAAGPLIIAFLVRAVLALTHFYVVPLPGSDKDAAAFLRDATVWSADGLQGTIAQFRTGSRLYAWLLAVLFALTSRSELMAQALNVLFGALMVYNIWRIVALLHPDTRAATQIAYIAALFPAFLLYAPLTLREVAVAYPFTLGLLYIARWWSGASGWNLYAAMILFAISSAFHSGMVFAIAATALTIGWTWLRALARRQGQTWLRATVAGSGLLVVALAILGSGVGLEKFGGSINNINSEVISNAQENAARSRAAYLKDDVPNSPTALAAQLPLREVYFFFSPFPWMVGTVGDLLALIDGLCYLAAAIILWRGRHVLWHEQTTRALLVMLLVVSIPFAITTSNFGTAMRHRAKLAPLVLVLAAVAHARRKRQTDYTGSQYLARPLLFEAAHD